MRLGAFLQFNATHSRVVRAAGASSLAALVAVSCREAESPPTAPVAAASTATARLAVSDPYSGDWNRLDADVDVIVESGGSPLLSKRKASRGMTYHLTRRRDPSGRWVSDIGFEDLVPRNPNLPAPGGPSHARRIRGTSANEPGTILDASGNPITVRIPESARTAAKGPEGIASVPQSIRTIPNAVRSAASAAGDTSRIWARIYFPTADGANLATEAADEVEDLPGDRRRIRRQRGALVTEITVNRATGAVEETRVLEQGRLRIATSRRYVPNPNGVLTLTSERKLHYPGGGGDPGVITINYRNIRLSKEQ